MFKTTINTSNAAFEDRAAEEVARILREIADRLEGGDKCGIARDVNGNSVGTFGLIKTN